MDPKSNPYLAHMYEEEDKSYGNDYENSSNLSWSNGRGIGEPALETFSRHKTTATMAHQAEDGPNNPFNGRPLSKRYFDILHTRRNLPVHVQR